MADFFIKIKDLIKTKTVWILALAIAIYIVGISILLLKKYNGFGYNFFDLSIFNQVFFNTLHGRWFDLSINLNNYLADHFSPVIILFLPIYAIYAQPQTLLIIQTVFIGLSAWPLYLIAKAVIRDRAMSLFVACWWLMSPFVHNANFFEFHFLSIAVFFVFWTFYFYYKNNFKLFVLFTILSLFCREDIALILLGFFALSLLDKKDLKWRIFTLLAPLVYFLAAIELINHFNVDGNYKFLIYYGWLGGTTPLTILRAWLTHPMAVLTHIFHLQNIKGVIIILLPFLFLPILRPKYLWLTFLPFLEFVLYSLGLYSMVYSIHYILLILPAIFISLIFAIKCIGSGQLFCGSHYVYNNFLFFKTVLVVSIIYFFIFISAVPKAISYSYNESDINMRQEFLSAISPQDKIAASLDFLPQLSNREFLYPTYYAYFHSSQFAKSDFILPPVDYILMSSSDTMFNLSERHSDSFASVNRQDLSSRWRKTLSDYVLVKAKNDIWLWQNKNKASSSLPVYEVSKKPDLYNFGFLLSGDLSGNILKLTFERPLEAKPDYLIRFYKTKGYFDMPLDYGLWPVGEWSEDSLYSFYYYLSDDIKAYQIFSWQGNNKLGNLRNITLDLQVVPVTDYQSLGR